ncbi:hypothetical protein ACPPVO_09570 [Dactylosporangium sp. McL0621]|uniref:hypothetical protein n=1 Tax=Dactylosporangium sp. McL0621 TaxID=3415678 RepID=UPI003CE73655
MAETYRKYTLPDLWKILKDEDPETGFVHVRTLNRVRTALEQQRDLLRAHRDRLVEGWPPDRSEAGAAFVDKLNGMIDTMTATAAAVSRIGVGVDEAFAAIRDARRQLEPMLAAYSGPNPGRGLPIAGAQQAHLDQQAREVLMRADAKITGAGGNISTDIPAAARFGESTEVVTLDSGSGGNASLSGRPASGGSAVSALLPAPRFDPPSPSPAAVGNSPGWVTEGGGLVLTGGAPSRSVPPAGTSVPPTVGRPTGVIGGGSPAVDRSRPTQATGMVPGGVIGGTRPAGSPREQTSAGPAVGGGVRSGYSPVAPRSRTSGRPTTSAQGEPARSSNGGAGGGYRDRSYEQYAERRRTKRGNDDELWSVEEGVSPVIDAPRERPHDPGPGVLGIDR